MYRPIALSECKHSDAKIFKLKNIYLMLAIITQNLLLL